MAGFCPIEVNILSYSRERGSNIASHFDDFWLWGERILGISLLSDTIMTYSRPDDPSLVLQVPLPRRSCYLMSGTSRTQWQHGIFAEHVAIDHHERRQGGPGERLVVTVRELTEEFMDFSRQPIGQELVQIASTYI